MTAENQKVKIVIADDHPMLLKGLKHSLMTENTIEIIGEAPDGQKALEMIMTLNPDIAILDYDMPFLNGLQILERVKEKSILTKIIFLTMHQDLDLFNKAISLDVDGFLLKVSVDAEIVKAIKSVQEGRKYFDPVLSASKYSKEKDTKFTSGIFMSLTKMERLVLKLVAENKTTSEIAEQLFISERTVDRHRSNICKKLDISGHNALMRFVIENKESIFSNNFIPV